jgi:flagellar biosynthesis/type III secretory pathway protein FliH
MAEMDQKATREYAWDEGLAEGRTQGLAEGLAEGRTEGLAEGERKIIELLKSGKTPVTCHEVWQKMSFSLAKNG